MSHYSRIAILLHWSIAAAIIANGALGFWMHRAIEDPAWQARAVAVFQLHKSIGLSVLLLSLLRLAWRLAHPPPPLPLAMPAWERWAARATHVAFYALMLALPFSGWLYVSTQWRLDAPMTIPTLWFGLFEVPHLPGLAQASREWRQGLAAVSLFTHQTLVWSTLILLVLHVAAALKHHFVERDEVLRGMLPAAPRRWALVLAPVMLIVTGIGAAALWSSGQGSSVAQPSAITSTPGGWRVDPTRSHIQFSGEHAGNPFNGAFGRWVADLQIDEDYPERSQIVVLIHTASASDGIKLHDETLPTAEWFDVANYPTARFESQAIRPQPAGGFQLTGTLSIKRQSIPINELRLRLVDGRLHVSGRLTLRRADANLGMESDPGGRWISSDIQVDVELWAAP